MSFYLFQDVKILLVRLVVTKCHQMTTINILQAKLYVSVLVCAYVGMCMYMCTYVCIIIDF